MWSQKQVLLSFLTVSILLFSLLCLTNLSSEKRSITITIDSEQELLERAVKLAIADYNEERNEGKYTVNFKYINNDNEEENEFHDENEIKMELKEFRLDLLPKYNELALASATSAMLNALTTKNVVVVCPKSDQELMENLKFRLDNNTEIEISYIIFSDFLVPEQIVKELVVQTDLKKEQNVIFASGKTLIDVAKVISDGKYENNYDNLRRARWFVLDLEWQQEQILLNDSALASLCTEMGLTTLTHLGDGPNGEVLRQQAVGSLLQNHARGQVSLKESLVYENLMNFMNRDFYESEMSSGILVAQQLLQSRDSFRVASHLDPDWMPLLVVEVEDNHVVHVETVETFLLDTKQFLDEESKCQKQHSKKGFNTGNFENFGKNQDLTLHLITEEPSLLSPLNIIFTRTTLPKQLLVVSPEKQDLALELSSCNKRSHLICQKDHQNELSCKKTEDEMSRDEMIPDEVRGNELRRYPRSIWSTYMSLTPEVFKCTATIAGCDFCLYFLATYNLTSSPAVCIGGCSLSTFGSCSALVGKALLQSIQDE